VVAAALIGGLAAATLVHASLTIAVIVSLVAGGIAVLVMVRSPPRSPEPQSGEPEDADFGRSPATVRRAAPPLSRDPRAASPASYAPPAPDPVAPPAPDPVAPPAPDPVAPPAPDPVAPGTPGPAIPSAQARGGPPAVSDTAVQLLPLPPPPGRAGPPPDAPWWDSAQGAPTPSAGAKRAPAPDLSTYLASTFIAQCPRCGAFRLDIRRARNGWNFRCESCEYTWTWQPGTPWPPVRVMPRGRRE
jgi:hypothetical protein